MNKKNTIKIIVDIIMTIIFTALLFAKITGLVFHEIAGIGIILLFGLHLFLNKNWIVGVSKKLFTSKLKKKTIWMYILNIGLFINILIVTVTGLLISSVIMPHDNYNLFYFLVHKWSAYAAALLIVVHLALHARYLVESFKKLSISFRTEPVMRGIRSIIAVVAIVMIVYYYIATRVYKDTSENPLVTNTPLDLTENINANAFITPYTSEEEEEEKLSIPNETSEATVSLAEFLSKMICTVCPKHCLLSNPRCRKSDSLVKEATAEYKALYGDEQYN